MPLRYDEIDEIKTMIKEAIDAAFAPKKVEVAEPVAEVIEPDPEPPVKKGKK